jgi:hypothetical protein
MSRYYDTSQPGGPRELDTWAGPYGPVRAGDLVAYYNPSLPDGQLGLDVLLTVDELIDFGGGHPVQAVLTGGAEVFEVSAVNLVPVRPADGTLVRLPDLRLALVLAIARFLDRAGEETDLAGVLAAALAAHVLAQHGDLSNNGALPTPWAKDLTAADDDQRDVTDVTLPGDPAPPPRVVSRRDLEEQAIAVLRAAARDARKDGLPVSAAYPHDAAAVVRAAWQGGRDAAMRETLDAWRMFTEADDQLDEWVRQLGDIAGPAVVAELALRST